MNRADKLLSVLRDGRPHARADIFHAVGYMLTNNAAAELRARGLVVEQWRERGNYIYKLGEAGPRRGESAATVVPPGAAAAAPPASPNTDPEQLTLAVR